MYVPVGMNASIGCQNKAGMCPGLNKRSEISFCHWSLLSGVVGVREGTSKG